jgi:hypothetical protein
VQRAWGPQLAMNRFLPLLATHIPTLWIHTSGRGGGGGGEGSDIGSKRAFDAHLCIGGSSRLVGSSGRVGGDQEERLPVLGARLCMDIIEREHQETFLESLINLCQVTLIKKNRKFSSYTEMEQLQSHI